MKTNYSLSRKTVFLYLLMIIMGLSVNAQIPADLMRNCNGWKMTYPTGDEEKQLCDEDNNEFFYVSDDNAIVFFAPVRSDNGTTPLSDYIRSELRERTEDGGSDIYWTTEGRHFLYVKQAITHLPMTKPHLVATQIHGNKADNIDDSMVMRLEEEHLFLSFNGGKLRDNLTIKTDYQLGTVHEVIFEVIDGKHYCYYSEDGNLLKAYQSGDASQYYVKDNGDEVLMDLYYDQTYFKVGNYTQSNGEKEGDLTDHPDNYGEVYVYDFHVEHGYPDPVAVSGVALSPENASVVIENTTTLLATVSPSDATVQTVSFKSSDESVATVDDNGVVTGKSIGTATITVTTDDGNYTATANISVENAPDPVSVTGVELSPATLTIKEGNTAQLTATVKPEDATIKTVSYMSSDESVATVDDNGNITAKSEGSATITVITDDGNYTARAQVTVEPLTQSSLIPADLMRNCNGWKITYPDGGEVKQLCPEENNEFFYVSDNDAAIVFYAPIRSDNGTTPLSSYIRSELRERTEDGSADIYWTTTGRHFLYVEQAITHLPITKPHLVATQIHGNKADDIDDSMVMRLEEDHLFLSFNGGKLRDNLTIKTGYVLGTKHEVIFEVIDGKHYCYYSEDGNLLTAYKNGDASQYYVKDNGDEVLMDLDYDQTYFKVGNYTQSNAEKEGDLTDDPDNYGEVYVYDFVVEHGYEGPVAVTGVELSPSAISVDIDGTAQLSAVISPSAATNKEVVFASRDESIAIVDQNGIVTGISEGVTTISVITNDGSYTAFAEITVKDIPDNLTNIALNKTVTASIAPDAETPAEYLVDGNTDNRMSSSGYPQTLTIDLGAIYDISYSELVFYEDRAYQYTISVASSEDGPFEKMVDRSSNTEAGSVASPLTDYFTISAQYIQLTVTGANVYDGSWVSILEFRVFGSELTTSTDKQSIVLKEGWNMVSTYINTENPQISTVFPNAEIVKTFDSFYSSAQADFLNTLTDIEAGVGYLVYNSVNETIEVTGDIVATHNTQSLIKGWNLVGVPTEGGLAIDILTDLPELEIIKDFDSFYQTGNDLSSLSYLEAGHAYYVLVSADCSYTISTKNVDNPIIITPEYGNITWKNWYLSVPIDRGDGSGKATSIYYEDIEAGNLTEEEQYYFSDNEDGSYTLLTKFTGYTTSGEYATNESKYCRTELREYWQGNQTTFDNWSMSSGIHILESTINVDHCNGSGQTYVAQIHGISSETASGSPATVKVLWDNGTIILEHYVKPESGTTWSSTYDEKIELGTVANEIFTIKLKVEDGKLYYGLVCEAKGINTDYTFVYDYVTNGYEYDNYFKTGNYFKYDDDYTETSQVKLFNVITIHE